MHKSIRINQSTYELAVMNVLSRGGFVRTGDIAIQFGISRTYARRILNSLYEQGRISRKVLQYRSNATVYEYKMIKDQKFQAWLHFEDEMTQAINEVYAIKHANEIAALKAKYNV